ncbi:BMP family ABC transporter substrate-binding protein [Pilimelia anulata]|uniref:BMP family ABC transporter substrate-binding protein n=1 Tax=Pilimelia anulata TaxID=53371 RepID=A0A8J3B3B0_9ACTN|nr:BMP family ABC transporter substrate-binding protein [Pilimelia anulata]GGJ92719.1 BMP family ABC transporter substrate-binding protein [Pilimelia anulata]
MARPTATRRLLAALLLGGLVAGTAACGEAPDKAPSGNGSDKQYTACMVTDVGGIDDRSFNTSAWRGIELAAKEDDSIEKKYVASTAESAYEPNLTGFLNQDCGFILAVGGLMADATAKVARAHADQQFGIVDAASALRNVYSMQFDTAQAAFLAGYLAAGYSKTGKVGTYGGMKIPPVTVFMDGFADGVAHFNKVKGADVKVLGWNKASQTGSFTNDFVKQDAGKKVSDALVAGGADVVMPVAGRAGLGTAADAQRNTGKYVVIWVDIDGCESAAQYCRSFLTTVVKNIPDAVKAAVLKGAGGQALAGEPRYLGTLANNGVSLAPYHQFEAKLSLQVKNEVDGLKQQIIDGKIKVTSAAQPK